MKKIEITRDLQLNDQELVMLDNHSILNILTILVGEIELAGMLVRREDLSDPVSQRVRELRSFAIDPHAGLDNPDLLDSMNGDIQELYDALENDPNADEEIGDILQDSKENAINIIQVLDARFRELIRRDQPVNTWENFSISELQQNFKDVFSAIAKNSKGGYGIVENIARKRRRDYYINLKIESNNGDELLMPPVLQDVLRDLIANARKYTKPGGEINAGLYNDGKMLKLVVSDTGMGIPEDEIELVVQFGYRAANALRRHTKGGGFGLTKAWFVTRELGGRMWIESEINKGTTIHIHIPVPGKS